MVQRYKVRPNCWAARRAYLPSIRPLPPPIYFPCRSWHRKTITPTAILYIDATKFIMAARIPHRLIYRGLSPAVGHTKGSTLGAFRRNPKFFSSDHFNDDSSQKDTTGDQRRRRRLRSPQEKENDAQKDSNPLDDFFANLGNSSRNQRSSSSRERRRSRQETSQSRNQNHKQPNPHRQHGSNKTSRSFLDGPSSVDAPIKTDGIAAKEEIKRVEMSSFFDEVNNILKQSKEKQKVKAATFPQVGETETKTNDRAPVSILDLLPPPKPPRGPDAYDEEAFDKYSELLDKIIEGEKFLGKHTSSPLEGEKADAVVAWLQAEEPVVKPNIPALEDALQGGSNNSNRKDIIGKEVDDWSKPESRPHDEKDLLLLQNQLSDDLSAQRMAFMEQQGWTKKQYEIAMKGLRQMGHLCAKTAVGQPIEIAWQKFLEAGYKMDKDVLETFLYVSSAFCSRDSALAAVGNSTSALTFGRGGSLIDFLDHNDAEEDTFAAENESNKTSTSPTFERETADTATQVALCKDILHGPCEQSTSIRVRVLVSQGKAKDAERLLDSSRIDDLRLRTYDPVLQYYLESGDVSSALILYTKMKGKETVLMRPETYIQLIACIAENGHFQKDATPIMGISELGYGVSSGPKLFDMLASELAENSVEISSSSAKRLYNALQKGFNDHDLRSLHLLESLPAQNEPASDTELVASRVTLDSKTGKCPRTGVQLRLINLDSEQKSQLKDGLLYLSSVAYEERSGKKDSKAKEELNRFGEWLETRSGEPFTAIVDGPNVAYYFQNFDGGTFNFHQIQFVVEALENMGENVLVILPKKYMQKSFVVPKVTGPIRQTVSKREQEIREKLLSSGKAYIVPPSLLDDYYWMYASICEQGTKFHGKEQYIPPGNEEGRWPGIRPMLVSNDQMRDHKLSLLEPRLFRRWYSNFIVNFTFSAFVGDQCVDKEIGFSTADFYSREIQGNAIMNNGDDSMVWHFPVSDWGECESFCVRIPSN